MFREGYPRCIFHKAFKEAKSTLQITQIVKIMCKDALAAILVFEYQTFKIRIRLYPLNDIECDSIDPQNPRKSTEHHCNQIIENVIQN